MGNRGGLSTIAFAAKQLGENVDLVEHVLSNSDNVDYADLMHVDDGSEVGITVITGRGTEAVEKISADVRTWPGGLRQFLIDDHCDPATTGAHRGGRSEALSQANRTIEPFNRRARLTPPTIPTIRDASHA